MRSRKHACRGAHPSSAPQRIRAGCTASMSSPGRVPRSFSVNLDGPLSVLCRSRSREHRPEDCLNGTLNSLASARLASLRLLSAVLLTLPKGSFAPAKQCHPVGIPPLEVFSAPPPGGLVRRLRRAQPGTRRCGEILHWLVFKNTPLLR